MAILLSAQNLEKSFGAQTLFKGLCFGIETGNRIGLIGPNGAGKSTLLKILAGKIEADGGEIAKSRGLVTGYLEQDPQFEPGVSVFDAISRVVHDPERLGSVHEWMARLDLTDPDSEVSKLSGGWRKRVALARELVREPNLLLLDEPTNHLDLESILWLEKLLAESSFATLTVTHDRMFLQRVANRIFDLDRRNPDGLFVFSGVYADYLDAKQLLMHAQERREEVVSNTLRRETEWLRRGAKARTTKQQARIERAVDLADEAQDLAARNLTRTAKIDFQTADRNPQKLIEATGISKSFGGRILFSPIDLLINPKTRLGLLGRNGSGKTTLIKILLGEESSDSGEVKRAEKLQVAYFAQYRDELNPKISVLRTLIPEGDYVNYRGQYIFARSYLSRFLFRPEQMDMPVEKLSGGEKARLRIAQLMLEKSNVLVLDEPTNDLDLSTLGVLEESLAEFDGAVILVTHDRYFLDQVANRILAFTVDEHGSGHLENFADTLQWEAWLESRPKTSVKKTDDQNDSTKLPKKKKRLGFKEKRELEGMEGNILSAETKLSELQRETEKPENIANSAKLTELFQEIAKTQSQIEEMYSRWAELEAEE